MGGRNCGTALRRKLCHFRQVRHGEFVFSIWIWMPPPPHTLIEIFALWNWVESRLSLCWVFYGWSQDGIVGNQGESREKRDWSWNYYAFCLASGNEDWSARLVVAGHAKLVGAEWSVWEFCEAVYLGNGAAVGCYMKIDMNWAWAAQTAVKWQHFW